MYINEYFFTVESMDAAVEQCNTQIRSLVAKKRSEGARIMLADINAVLEKSDLEAVREEVQTAFEIMRNCYENGGKLLVCGNGGSASDAEHIVGELMKGFIKLRPIPEQEQEAIGEMGRYLRSFWILALAI